MMAINFQHLKALLGKEVKQILADKSVFIVAFFIPLMLILIYGSGIRMDIKPLSMAIVTPHIYSSATREILFAFQGSDYFKLKVVFSDIQAQELMLKHEISAYVSIPSNLAQNINQEHASLMITINGVDAQSANITRSYIESVLRGVALSPHLSRQYHYINTINAQHNIKYQDIMLNYRSWFNESNNSTWYLLTGQMIGAITLMAAFMASIVIAREFERGTMLGLMATNINALELFLSKLIPYFILSILGATLSILCALVLYNLPFRGSIILFILTILLYLYVSVLIGLVISIATQNQFLSSEYAVILSFLPSILLSGAIFDLRSVPNIIAVLAHFFPPTYAVSSAKICILSGGSEHILWYNLMMLFIFALALSLICYFLIKRHFKRYIIGI